MPSVEARIQCARAEGESSQTALPVGYRPTGGFGMSAARRWRQRSQPASDASDLQAGAACAGRSYMGQASDGSIQVVTVFLDSSGEAHPYRLVQSASLLPASAWRAPSPTSPCMWGPASAYLGRYCCCWACPGAGTRRGSTHRVNQTCSCVPEVGLCRPLADGIGGPPHGEVAARVWRCRAALLAAVTQLSGAARPDDLPAGPDPAHAGRRCRLR